MNNNKKVMKYIPQELVNIIADFHDYEKYCKPVHKKMYQPVLFDIISMGEIMVNTISAKIAKECWGPNPRFVYNENLVFNDDEWLFYDNENMVGLYNEDE